MPRSPTDFGALRNQEILARAARGESPNTIAHAMGMPQSERTIRRLIERKPELVKQISPRVKPRQPAKAKPEAKDEIAISETLEVPEDATERDIEHLIAQLNKAANKAEQQGNLTAFASIAAKVTTLLALREKRRPLPKPDINDNPDYKAFALVAREKLKKLADGLFANDR